MLIRLSSLAACTLLALALPIRLQILLVDIEYSNYDAETHSMLPSVVTYTYRVSTVNNTEYKYVETDRYSEVAYERQRVNRHGVRILVSQSGRIGYFDFQTLLINLTVSFGLLSAAYFVMDVIALR